jgi:hypothetical protein
MLSLKESRDIRETREIKETKETLDMDSLFNGSNNTYFNELIISKIKEYDFQYILNHLCFIKDDYIVIDFNYFKPFATTETYPIITQFVVQKFDEYLAVYPQAIIHLNISSLSLTLLDKHKTFFVNISQFFAIKYPNILKECYVYNATFIFSQLFSIVSLFVDKVTMQKIQIVKR